MMEAKAWDAVLKKLGAIVRISPSSQFDTTSSIYEIDEMGRQLSREDFPTYFHE
ncbi:hypothetical protein J437_LFUL013836 [Ladona fulva]|uniref:Uncharacterized protein n=1 Tax=Ladona fulva TaxID=123851 RepID=A0A8K0KEK6_LADFU|nr:hypothetical protein J437_LFUL013836 [Ladona fulva]